MQFHDVTDRLPLENIEQIQADLLVEMVHYVYERSSYYRRKFDLYGVKPPDIRGLDDIAKLPLTSREDLQRENWDFLAVSKQDIAEIVSTTGTTGEPAFIALTENDLKRLACNEEKSFSLTGAGKEDSFHIAVTHDNLFIAGIAYYSGLLKLGSSVVRIGPQNAIRHVDLIGKLRPTGIVAVPTLMTQIVHYAHRNGMNVRELGLEKIVLIGDAIRNSDFSTNSLGSMIEDAFGKKCYSTYGITEGQVSFCECAHRSGLHSHPDLVLAEVVDDEGRPLPDGETGELVLTTLRIEGMPLIRYRTGDITFRISGQCPCGRNSLRICSITGRKNQRLKIKGVTLYPKTIENAILEIKEVINYQIEAYTADDHTDHVRLWIGSHRNDSGLRSSLIENLRAKARVSLKVKIESPDAVRKRLFENSSRKAVTFRDMRDKPV
jgi:phenylacetate-CoA ligase